MGLLKTVDFIVGNPYRSRFWKIVDVTALSILWSTTIVVVVVWLGGNALAWTTWEVPATILVPLTLFATARSWYKHPRTSKRARERMLLESQGSELK